MAEINAEDNQFGLDEGLTQEQVTKLWESFSWFDADGSATIDSAELAAAMQAAGLNITDEEVQTIIDEFDGEDGDNALNFQQYCQAMKRFIKQVENKDSRKKKLSKAFAVFAPEGTITVEELREIMTGFGNQCLSDEEVDALLEMVDADGDGNISCEEYVEYFSKDVEEFENEEGA